jgi:antitoxin component YwqK of YwqJK toxin-antitoxin module
MGYLHDPFWKKYNPHGQILSTVRSRQRERVASALNFYGLGDYDDMKISENGVMLYNRDKTSIRERLAKLKEVLSDAEKGNMKAVESVQNSKKELIHNNFKEEGSILLKFMEIIIEREEMFDDLIKAKEAEVLKNVLGEEVIPPYEL